MRGLKLFALTACTAFVLLGGMNAFADDSEIFFGNTANAGSPNILLIIDTSGSMSVEAASGRYVYDPNKTYTISGCTAGYVYYEPLQSATGKPSCSSSNKIPKTNFTCTPAATAFATSAGQYSGNAIRWVTQTTTTTTGSGKNKKNTTTYAYYWAPNLNLKGTGISLSNDVTCQQDTDSLYPTYGTISNPPSPSPSDGFGGTSTSNYFTLSNSPTLTSYVFYDSNYVAYLNDSSQNYTQNRLQVVKSAAINLINSLSGVNVGLMTYSSNGNGGRVVAAVQDVTTGAPALISAINDLHTGGNTPLSETLYEAYLYFAGATPLNGLNGTSCSQDMLTCDSAHTVSAPSVAASLSGGNYKSPIQSSCENNYIVYLTDGLPNADNGTDSKIEGLNNLTTGCYKDSQTMWKALGYSSVPSINYYDGTTGLCTKELSRYMFTNGFTSTSTSGTQHVSSYFIGFGNDVGGGAAQAYLADAAVAGGGTAIAAGDATSLAAAFQQAIGAILNTSATFASPSVAVDAFNKTEVLEDLYIAMFKPSPTRHWPGNVKKFKLRNGQIVGKDLSNAVDTTTGFFNKTTQDFWQLSSDTNADPVGKGGAANRIPATTNRKVYTYLGTSKNLTDASNSFDVPNVTAIETAGLGTTSVSTPTSTALINWARGDSDGDTTVTTDIRHQMGDPIHSQPAVVIYGNDSTATTTLQKLNDAVVYSINNDGFLHAIDVKDATDTSGAGGTELWSFIPPELIGDQLDLFNNFTTTPVAHYDLDGDIRILKYDVNNNGVVDIADGDRVFIYFSQGRGGEHYYALDIADKNKPKFQWSLDSTTLSAVSKSWSAPTLGKVNIKGATQNPQKLVLIFAGGYDDSEEAEGYISTGDAHGNALYIVDAVKGTLLWHAGSSSDATADLSLSKMTHAIPSNVTVLDTNGDGYSDRMYVGDLAGQLWRFDITNGNSASTLVAGGVIASLGEKGQSSPTNGDIANNRTFFSAPDIAKITQSCMTCYNYYDIAIGSGDRSMPKSNTTTQDYFYGIRDYQLLPMVQSTYNTLTPIKQGDLTTVNGTTATTIANAGWKLALNAGEKSLSQSDTVNSVIMFTTYVPGATANANTCSAVSGSGRAYSVYATSGFKYFEDLYEDFNTTGLPSQISIVNDANLVRTDGTTSSISSSASSGSSGSSCTAGLSTSSCSPTTCLVGVNPLGNCVNYGDRLKSFWQESGAK